MHQDDAIFLSIGAICRSKFNDGKRKATLYKVHKCNTLVRVKTPYWKMTPVKVKVTCENTAQVKVLKYLYLSLNINI